MNLNHHIIQSAKSFKSVIRTAATTSFYIIFSSQGELLGSDWSRRPFVSIHTFKLEYLRDQWVDLNQILSEASLGGGKAAVGFGPVRVGTLVSMSTRMSHRVTMEKILLAL